MTRRIRNDFDMIDDSWQRVARSVGKDVPELEARTADNDGYTEEEADRVALQLLESIYTAAGELPGGMGSLVLTRIADDLALQPAVNMVTAQSHNDLMAGWETPPVGEHIWLDNYGEAVVDEVFPDGTYLVTLADVQGAGTWNQAMVVPKVVPSVQRLR